MKRIIILISTTIFLMSPQILLGKEKPTSPPPNVPYNISGTWNFQTSDHKEYGECQVGAPYSGKLTITQKDTHHLTMVMESGPTVCSPAAVCSYKGVMKEDEAKFFNTVVAEGQAGTLIDAIDLKVSSNNAAAGEVRNIQQFVGGSMCEWVHKIQLTR
jgi:hypothetical protein